MVRHQPGFLCVLMRAKVCCESMPVTTRRPERGLHNVFVRGPDCAIAGRATAAPAVPISPGGSLLVDAVRFQSLN